MRYHEILESAQLASLLSASEHAVETTVKMFVEKTLEEFRGRGTAERRKQLGYHPYQDAAANHARFDQGSYDDANSKAGWDLDSGWIGDNLGQLIPDPGAGANSPVYALMGEVSNALTRVMRKHVDQQYGPSVLLHTIGKIRKVDDIYVTVWWRSPTGRSSLGVYYADTYHANGNRTDLSVVANRERWTEWLREEISSMIAYDAQHPERFFDSIANTLMHEYRHLEQDIKGTRSMGKGLIRLPTTHGPWDLDDTNYARYLGRFTEIDAHATAAAAQVIAGIISSKARYARRYDQSWTAEKIPDDEWNDAVKDAMLAISGGTPSTWPGDRKIPSDEYKKYVAYMNAEHPNLDPRIKKRYMLAAKQRFLKTYVNRLRGYMRSSAPGKLSVPIGPLPE